MFRLLQGFRLPICSTLEAVKAVIPTVALGALVKTQYLGQQVAGQALDAQLQPRLLALLAAEGLGFNTAPQHLAVQ
jgi:hypothetical protein